MTKSEIEVLAYRWGFYVYPYEIESPDFPDIKYYYIQLAEEPSEKEHGSDYEKYCFDCDSVWIECDKDKKIIDTKYKKGSTFYYVDYEPEPIFYFGKDNTCIIRGGGYPDAGFDSVKEALIALHEY